jgi:hypothetical protein
MHIITELLTLKSSAVRFLTMFLLAFTFSFAAAENVSPNHAFAASKAEKAKKGLKFTGKAFDKLRKAGEKAQQKRGISKGFGKAMANIGRSGGKATKGLSKGIGKVQKGTSKILSKSKAGRAMQKGYRNAGKWQNKQINKAFRNCRGRACQFGKDIAKTAAPL